MLQHHGNICEVDAKYLQNVPFLQNPRQIRETFELEGPSREPEIMNVKKALSIHCSLAYCSSLFYLLISLDRKNHTKQLSQSLASAEKLDLIYNQKQNEARQ